MQPVPLRPRSLSGQQRHPPVHTDLHLRVGIPHMQGDGGIGSDLIDFTGPDIAMHGKHAGGGVERPQHDRPHHRLSVQPHCSQGRVAERRTAVGDAVGQVGAWDLIVCGDIFYEAPMARRVLPWLRSLAAETEIWVADPGRAYLPASGLEPLAAYDVPTSLDLEDRTVRRTTVYRLLA